MIGIFGGTFDPVHNGHLKTLEYVHKALSLDSIFIVPLGQAVHPRSDEVVRVHVKARDLVDDVSGSRDLDRQRPPLGSASEVDVERVRRVRGGQHLRGLAEVACPQCRSELEEPRDPNPNIAGWTLAITGQNEAAATRDNDSRIEMSSCG